MLRLSTSLRRGFSQRSSLLMAGFLFLSALSPAWAALNTPLVRRGAGTTGPIDPLIRNDGDLVLAVNLGSATNVTRNAVPFSGAGPVGNPSGPNWFTSAPSVDSTLGGGATIDPLFFSEVWGGAAVTLTLSNLNPERHYLIQILHGEPRACCSGTFTNNDFVLNFSTALPVPSFVLGNSKADENPPNTLDRAIVEVEVAGQTSVTYRAKSGVGRGGSIAGFQVRDVTQRFVTNLLDSGPGSLREMINTSAPGDIIRFKTNGVIGLLSTLVLDHNLSIEGPGPDALAIDGQNVVRILSVLEGSTNRISGLTFRNGLAPRAPRGLDQERRSCGGGIQNAGSLVLQDCVFRDNRAGNGADGPAVTDGGDGGAIDNLPSPARLTLIRCTFLGNVAGTGGDGKSGIARIIRPPGGNISYIGEDGESGGHGGRGGAVFANGVVIVENCTFSANYSGNGGNGGNGSEQGLPNHAGNGGNGGNGGAIAVAGELHVVSGTLSGNGTGAGGKMGFFGDNSESKPGGRGQGGGMAVVNGLCDLRNTLVAANVAAMAPDIFGSVTSLGYNLLGVSDGSAGIADAANNDLAGSQALPLEPVLGPVANNGGLTPTMALLFTSPALQRGDASLSGTDQRGEPRSQGGRVDIGAFESVLVNGSPLFNLSSASVISSDPSGGVRQVTFRWTANPFGPAVDFWVEYGISTAYGGRSASVRMPGTNSLQASEITLPLAADRAYHWRVAGRSVVGSRVLGPDATLPLGIPGDTNGDGVVDNIEVLRVLDGVGGNGVINESLLDQILARYWASSPWLLMTNVAGLGGTNVVFTLEGAKAGSFTVESSPDLQNWTPIGKAVPLYQFTDTNAPTLPAQSYRLRFP